MSLSEFRGQDAGWSDPKNRLLALAVKVYERSLCPDCRQDRGRSHDDKMDGWYNVQTEVCYGCAEVEQYQRDAKAEPPAGMKLYVVEDEQAPD